MVENNYPIGSVLRDISNIQTRSPLLPFGTPQNDKQFPKTEQQRRSLRSRKPPARFHMEQFEDMKKEDTKKKRRIQPCSHGIKFNVTHTRKRMRKAMKETIKEHEMAEEESIKPIPLDKTVQLSTPKKVKRFSDFSVSMFKTPEKQPQNVKPPSSLPLLKYEPPTVPMIRPQPETKLPIAEGIRYAELISKKYSLQELRDFCRENSLRITGNRTELAKLIIHFLDSSSRFNLLLTSPGLRCDKTPFSPFCETFETARTVFSSPIVLFQEDRCSVGRYSKLNDCTILQQSTNLVKKKETRKRKEVHIPKSEYAVYQDLQLNTLCQLKQYCARHGIQYNSHRGLLKRRILNHIRNQLTVNA